jgi:hypothetical protein
VCCGLPVRVDVIDIMCWQWNPKRTVQTLNALLI